MKIMVPLAAVAGLFLLGMLGGIPGIGWVFGVVLPYAAVVAFVGGLIMRIMDWARSDVPFRIPTTSGQQRSLEWIEQNKFDNPYTTFQVIGRMALEVLFFRSLLKNTKTSLVDGKKLVYSTEIWLWLAGLVMHWSLLVVLVRHLRLMMSPVPGFITILEGADGFLEIGLPVFFITSFTFLGGLAYLLYRRMADRHVKYISLAGDYFPLFLLLGIGISGFFMRYLTRTDVASIKELMLGLTHFSPVVPDTISALFFGHLFLVCVLLAYIPLSKLSHMVGVFLSPTRNLANNNRAVRHVNPWDYDVKVHTYEEYEDELREKMVGAGIPVEKELSDV
ncbi:sulfate reduction electron transfer complex DsrMKJOP subunit DsrM [Candidatus Zixiibacteriota bacterium]